MITKIALFQGKVRAGKHAEMRAFVESRLQPLWEAFDGAHRVRVLWTSKSDPKAPANVLALEVDYKTAEDLERAMASPARYESRDMLPGFYEAFFEDCTLLHHEFETTNNDG